MDTFTAYLQSKNHATSTQRAYLTNVALFLNWISKEAEQATKKDVLHYLEHLHTKRSQSNVTRRNSLIAIDHYYSYLQQRGQVATKPTALIHIRGTRTKNLCRTYTPEELEQLYDSYHQLYVRDHDHSHIPKNQRHHSFLCRHRNAAILSLLIHQGVAPKELDQLLLQDIDLGKATVNVRGGKRRGCARTLPLRATQIGPLIHYINTIRPQFFSLCTESEKLFFALPASGKQSTSGESLLHVFKPLAKQLRTIDRRFVNIQQLRTSVITNWLKSEGLRKAQYLAGHRSIHSTEEYRPNQIEELTEDIGKFNPF